MEEKTRNPNGKLNWMIHGSAAPPGFYDGKVKENLFKTQISFCVSKYGVSQEYSTEYSQRVFLNKFKNVIEVMHT